MPGWTSSVTCWTRRIKDGNARRVVPAPEPAAGDEDAGPPSIHPAPSTHLGDGDGLGRLPRRRRSSGLWVDDLDNDRFVDDEAIASRSLVGDQPQFGRSMATKAIDPVLLGQDVMVAPGGWLTQEKRLVQRSGRDTECRSAIQERLQPRRRAGIGDRRQVGHRLHLPIEIGGTGRNDGAAERPCPRIGHQPIRHEMVVETIEDDVATSETCRIHGTRKAPIIAASALQAVERPRRGK